MSKRTAKIEMFRDTAGGWRWRFRAANGAIIAGPEEAYRRPGECRRGAVTVTDAEARGIPIVTVAS